MYRTHNDLVVRTVDVNEKPIQGVSVRVSKTERPIPDIDEGILLINKPVLDDFGKRFRQKRDLDYEGVRESANGLPQDSQGANLVVDNLEDYDSSMSESAAVPRTISAEEEYALPDNFQMPATEEGSSDVEDEPHPDDDVGSEYISTNELGEATFPRRPVGSVLVIEVKGKVG